MSLPKRLVSANITWHTLFKREYGVSPINYIIDCRIREGKRLLAETDLAPSQIASILGFFFVQLLLQDI